MQRESYPRIPSVLLKANSNTDPPESQISAKLQKKKYIKLLTQVLDNTVGFPKYRTSRYMA